MLINEVYPEVISDDKLETITEMITLASADVNKKVKKGKYYHIQQANRPFTGCAMIMVEKRYKAFSNKEILVILLIDNFKITDKKLMG